MENFKQFIEWMNDNTEYVVLWGYEGLPEQIHGGDVDIFISPVEYEKVVDELHRRGYRSSLCPHYSDLHRHEQVARQGDYTLHLCDSFCFVIDGKSYLLKVPATDILQKRRLKLWEPEKGFWISSRTVEALLTALRVIAGRKDCMNRLKNFLEEIS